jgi:hypothetical protein
LLTSNASRALLLVIISIAWAVKASMPTRLPRVSSRSARSVSNVFSNSRRSAIVSRVIFSLRPRLPAFEPGMYASWALPRKPGPPTWLASPR